MIDDGGMDMIPVLRATVRSTIDTCRQINALVQDWKQVEQFASIHPTLDRIGKDLMARATRLIDIVEIEKLPKGKQ